MYIRFEQSGTVAALAELLAEAQQQPEVRALLVLVCDDNGFTPSQLDPVLHACRLPLFGGIFPAIIAQGQQLRRGSLLIGLSAEPRLACVPALSNPATDFDAILTEAFPDTTSPALQSMFVFVDGFSSRIGALLDALFNAFGLEINYLGGGCGSLSLQQKPCVLSNQGLLQDCALVALLPLPSGIGVAHGWLPISEAFKVTEAHGNVIESLDWRPAYQVYQEVVEAHSGLRFAEQDFFAIAKAYPFGMAKLDAEMVVRDPLMRQGESLVCVGEVPQGAFVSILHGSGNSLLAAATQARLLARHSLPGIQPQVQLFIDCISRALFLEENFDFELEAVRDDHLPLVGALTLGEIANSGRDYLEFYNKTAVVGLF